MKTPLCRVLSVDINSETALGNSADSQLFRLCCCGSGGSESGFLPVSYPQPYWYQFICGQQPVNILTARLAAHGRRF